MVTIATDDHHELQEFRLSVGAHLGTPGLREAWDAGDLSHFHGWERWSVERVAAARGLSDTG